MNRYIIYLLFFPIIFCTLQKIPISKIANKTYDKNHFYCSTSKNDSINLYYQLAKTNYHLIYDRNEEFISESQEDSYSIVKLEYFSSNKDYLYLNKHLFLYYK